jgi:hypothetical protein
MTTATITFTDDRTLPMVPEVNGKLGGSLMLVAAGRSVRALVTTKDRWAVGLQPYSVILPMDDWRGSP